MALRVAQSISRLGSESAFEVLARANAVAPKAAAMGKPMINLGIGQPDFPTPENIVEAGRKALKDGHHGYTAANGTPELRAAVAEDIFNRYGVEVNASNILAVPGGKVTMAFAMMMFGEAGKEILYPNPGFPIYESMIRFSGATPVPIKLHEDRNFSFDADEVLSQITEKTSLIILNSPANPTGGITDQVELDKLVAGLEAYPDVAILSDEIYSRMCYDGLSHVSLLTYPQLRDRLIVLDGWSKTYAMTGWRMGWGYWPDELIDAATRLAINTHSCVNAAAQFAGIEALRGPQEAVGLMTKAFDERRRRVVDLCNDLPGVKCVTPKGAFYAFPNISDTGIDAETLQNRLIDEAFVATIAGTSFGHMGQGYLRLSYANSLENIEEALARIKTLLEHSI